MCVFRRRLTWVMALRMSCSLEREANRLRWGRAELSRLTPPFASAPMAGCASPKDLPDPRRSQPHWRPRECVQGPKARRRLTSLTMVGPRGLGPRPRELQAGPLIAGPRGWAGEGAKSKKVEEKRGERPKGK